MNRELCALVFATTALIPLGAHAQQAGQQAQNATGDTTVGEIVVTAERRSERLEDVPVAITAVSGSQLAAANITELRSLVTLAPALRMDQTGIFTQPTIRGVGSAVTGPGANSNVALYVDGFYQPSQAGNDFDLSNVTQVQVLKGPQGTLFGRNATGGAILITTADPSSTPHGSVDVSYRSYDDRRVDLYYSAPITDTLAGNISLYGRKSDGWKTDLVTGAHDSPNDTFDARGKLLWRPTDRLQFLLTLQHVQIEDPAGAAYTTYLGNSIGNVIPGVIVANDRFNTAMPQAPKNLITADAAYLKSQYSWDWATLTSYTGYRKEKDEENSQLDRTSADLFDAYWQQTERTFTEEVNLSSAKTGRVNWVVGAFFDGDKSGYPYFFFNADNSGGAAYVKTRAAAGYADITWQVLDHLFLTGGLRYSDEKQSFTFNAAAATGQTSHDWTSLNERLVLRYEFSPRTNVYASYSNGFKSGAYNTLTFSTTPVNPEKIDAYEIGFKTAQSNWRFDTSAFYYNYRDLQFTAYKFVTVNGVSESISELLNAARAKIYGADAQIAYNVTEDLNVRLGAAWTHARYGSFPGSILYIPNVVTIGGRTVLAGNSQTSVDAGGKTMVRAPDFTLTAGADYTHPLPYGRLTLSGNVYYSSTVYFDPNDSTSQPGYATLDLKATWTLPSNNVSLYVFGDNVTDTKYVTQVAEDAFGYGAVYGTPSVFGAGVEAKF